MRLTRAGEYAVRCMLYLFAHNPGHVCARKAIAESMDIPDQFLGKIAQQLSRAGFIEIVQGPKGGYRALIAPRELTLLDVVEAVNGEIFLNDCVMRPSSCTRSPSCPVHQIWLKARRELRNILNGANFERLLAEGTCNDGPRPPKRRN